MYAQWDNLAASSLGVQRARWLGVCGGSAGYA